MQHETEETFRGLPSFLLYVKVHLLQQLTNAFSQCHTLSLWIRVLFSLYPKLNTFTAFSSLSIELFLKCILYTIFTMELLPLLNKIN